MGIIRTNSQYYTNIADAIRDMSGSQDTFYPSEMTAGIRSIPQFFGVTPADVYNHGSIVGINKYYQCYECQNDNASYAGFNTTKNYYNVSAK